MARTRKYEWPNDQKLQALLDVHGTVETARQVGCPPSSLSNRIRRRGLRGPKEETPPAAARANGRPDAAKASEEPVRERDSAEVPDREHRGDMEKTLEHLGSADYGARQKPWNPGALEARSLNGDARDKRSQSRPAVEPPQKGEAARARRTAPRRRLGVALPRLPGPIWRAMAVLALAALAGIAAFISVSGDPKTYQRESSFAVRPSPTVPPAAVNDVIGTLAQPDSAITETIVNMLGSQRLSSFAAQSAGVPASSVGASGTPYVWSATRRTGSTIIDVRVTGPKDDKLLAMQTAAGPEAARLVEESYTPYRLESLSAPTSPVQVGPKITQTVGLAILLGGLLGITLVLLERRLRLSLGTGPQREKLARAPTQRGETREP
jgi:hypothetical protein